MASRGIIGPNSILNSKFFKDLARGIYEVQGGNLDYLPLKWGTLINFRGSSNYGVMVFYGGFGLIYTRAYSINNDDWYTGWTKIHDDVAH